MTGASKSLSARRTAIVGLAAVAAFFAVAGALFASRGDDARGATIEDAEACLGQVGFRVEPVDARDDGGGQRLEVFDDSSHVATLFFAEDVGEAKTWLEYLRVDDGNGERHGTVVYQAQARPGSFDESGIVTCIEE
jgi:hypothetical protein